MIIEPSARIPGLRLPKFIKISNEADDGKANKCVTHVEESISSTDKSKLVDNLVQTESCKTLQVQVQDTLIETPADITAMEEDKIITLPISSREVDENQLEVCIEDDDNVSVLSQTESLRIDESFPLKDNQSSPYPDVTTEISKQNCQLYCKQCDRYYKNRNGLRVHQETVHGSDRPFPCPVCDQAFKTKGSLVRHTRIHTGERPFRCGDCGRAFRDSGILSRHIHNLHRNMDKRPKDVKVLITRISDTSP